MNDPNPALCPGTPAYHVVRFSPPAQRTSLEQWFGWFAHIDTIAAKANDPGVARLKLDWWRDEAQRMQEGRARHPLVMPLQDRIHASWQVFQMQRSLDAVEQRILRRQPADEPALLAQCAAQCASRLHLLCASNDDRLESIGIFVGIVQRLGSLQADLRDHYLSLPAQTLRTCGCSPQSLEKQGAPVGLVEHLVACGGAFDLRKLRRLHGDHALRPALRVAAQQVALLQKLRAGGKPVPLGPFSAMWHAWRLRN